MQDFFSFPPIFCYIWLFFPSSAAHLALSTLKNNQILQKIWRKLRKIFQFLHLFLKWPLLEPKLFTVHRHQIKGFRFHQRWPLHTWGQIHKKMRVFFCGECLVVVSHIMAYLDFRKADDGGMTSSFCFGLIFLVSSLYFYSILT